jgi:sterol desaturase/sphingolipid hydroxylase (fatty acid hydroxylase superfamily)
MDSLWNALSAAFGTAQQHLFEAVVQPLLFHLGLASWLEDGFRATGWLLVGVIQLLVMVTLLRALERRQPVEAVRDGAAVRVDIVYTLVHRLGLFRVLMFLTLEPLWLELMSQWRLAGGSNWQLDDALNALWMGLGDIPWVAFFAYLVVFDAVDFLIHRAQHRFNFWWALHAVHHSQRQMTLWTDNRNHLLDDVLRDSIFVLVAFAIGVPPGQFVAVVAVTQLLESLSHANVRLHFGPVLGRFLVSPHYHRLHHAIGLGHESRGPGSLGGCNFAVLFPLWDILCRTAVLKAPVQPTGIRDQLPESGAREYGRGFWAQQRLGMLRLAAALRGRPAA